VRTLDFDPKRLSPLALVLIAGLFIFALAKPGHGPIGAKTTLHCRSYVAATPRRGRVAIEKIAGAGMSCAQAKRVLGAWLATDLLKTGRLAGGFRCGFDTPILNGRAGGCRRARRVGVRFDIRFNP
jgi:hypothetical protein